MRHNGHLTWWREPGHQKVVLPHLCYHRLTQRTQQTEREGQDKDTCTKALHMSLPGDWGNSRENHSSAFSCAALGCKTAHWQDPISNTKVPWFFPFCGNASANTSSIPYEQVLPAGANATVAPRQGTALENLGARRGCESRVPSALGREGKGETLLLSRTTWSEDKRKMEPVSSQRWTVIGQETTNIIWNIINSNLTQRKKRLGSNTRTRLKEAAGAQSTWRCSKLDQTPLKNLIWKECLWAGDWTRLSEVPSTPNYFIMLWLCDSSQTV